MTSTVLQHSASMQRTFGRLLTWIAQHHRAVLWSMVVLYTLVLFGGLTYKFYHWGIGYDQIDYQQAIWNTTQGRFLEISHYRHTDSLWGMDFIPAILLLVPFYALFPSQLTLNFFQAFFMALGALPVYGVARDRFGGNRLAGLGWAGVYLLYPSVWFVTMDAPWQPRTMAVPALLGAFYFFQESGVRSQESGVRSSSVVRSRWLRFHGLLLLALTARTDVALVVVAFGLLAAVWRRGWRWVMPPLVLGLAWFYLSTAYIVPSFYRADYQPQEGQIGQSYEQSWPGKSPQLAYYSHLGNSAGEIVWNIVSRPVATAQLMLEPPKVEYLVLMLLPLLFLPLLAPDVALLAAPILAMNLLSTRVYQYVIRGQYQALVIPGLILAAIVGAARLYQFTISDGRFTQAASIVHRPSSIVHRPSSIVMLGLLAYALVVNLVLKNPVISTVRNAEDPQRIAVMNEMRARVPPAAPLATTSFQAVPMMPRRYIYYLPNVPAFPPLERAEYLFLDLRASGLQDTELVQQIRASPATWQILDERADLMLVRRVAP